MAKNETIGTVLKIEKGYTLCAACNRSMRTEDVDKNGLCPDCVAK